MRRTTLLLGALTGLIMLIGQWLGGLQGLVIAFISAVLMNFGSYWFSDKIVLAAYGAQPVSAESQHVPLKAFSQTAHLFIVNPLTGCSLMRLFSTHPPLADRIACLRAMTERIHYHEITNDNDQSGGSTCGTRL